jgi:galactonate dehydratase
MIAASLQVAAASPHVRVVEYQPVVLDAANRLLRAPIACQAGRIRVPEGPGLGIEVDDAALARFAVD